MIKKLFFVIVAVICVFSMPLLGAEESVKDPALVKAYQVIEEQNKIIQDLQYERERLLAQIRDLNETINDIRSRVGGGGYQPT